MVDDVGDWGSRVKKGDWEVCLHQKLAVPTLVKQVELTDQIMNRQLKLTLPRRVLQPRPSSIVSAPSKTMKQPSFRFAVSKGRIPSLRPHQSASPHVRCHVGDERAVRAVRHSQRNQSLPRDRLVTQQNSIRRANPKPLKHLRAQHRKLCDLFGPLDRLLQPAEALKCGVGLFHNMQHGDARVCLVPKRYLLLTLDPSPPTRRHLQPASG